MSTYGTLHVFIIIIHNKRSVKRNLLTEYAVTETQAREMFTAFQKDNFLLEHLNAKWQPNVVPL